MKSKYKRVAIYVSSHDHRQEEQIERCQRYVEGTGIKVVQVIRCYENANGLNDSLVDLLHTVKAELIDAVFVTSFNRLSRDCAFLNEIENYCWLHNVTIVKIQEDGSTEELRDN